MKMNLIDEVLAGNRNGEYFFICDIRNTAKPLDKFIRHVPPQRVLIRDDRDTDKHIYYSESHAVKLSKTGQPLKAVIALVDNTGWRRVAGTPVQIFETMAECIEKYIEQRETASAEKRNAILAITASVYEFDRATKEIEFDYKESQNE